MDNADTYFMQMPPPPLDGLFGADDTTPAAAHNAPPRATEREEQAVTDATHIEHMAKRVKPETVDERLVEFIRQHPDVLGALVNACRKMKRAGVKQWSIDAAFHVVRYEHHTSAHAAAELYKDEAPVLNNSMTAPMGRYIMATFPDLAGYFETRRRRCELPGCLEVAND